MKWRWSSALVLVLMVAACGAPATPDPSPTPPPAGTPAPAPTWTATLWPTATPPPALTATPRPTATPSPTSVLSEAQVPVPPAPTPSPSPSPTATSTPTSPFRPASWPGEEARHLWIAPDGRLWLTTDTGIFIRAGDGWEQCYEGMADGVLGTDAAGRVWAILDNEQAIAAYGGTAWTIYGPDQGWTAPPPAEYYKPGYGDTLVTDRLGRVWLATGGDDLRRFDPQTQIWTVMTATGVGFEPPEDEGYQGHFLTDVALDNAGNVWVGDCIGQGELHLGQGVRWFDGERWNGSADTAHDCVYDIKVDDAGRVWIGGSGALIQYDPAIGAWSRTPSPSWERGGLVTSIALDAAGNPWVNFLRCGGASCYGNVLYHLQAGEWIAAYAPKDLWYSPVGPAFGPDGAAWLCAGGTVYRLAGGQTDEMPINSDCRQIKVDGDGRIWVLQERPGRNPELWWLEP